MTNSDAYVVSLGFWQSEENNGRALSTISVASSLHSNKKKESLQANGGQGCKSMPNYKVSKNRNWVQIELLPKFRGSTTRLQPQGWILKLSMEMHRNWHQIYRYFHWN